MSKQTGYERFCTSEAFKKIKLDSMTKAEAKWAAASVKFRRFLARQAGLEPEAGEGKLSDLSEFDQEKLYRANKLILEWAAQCREPLITACISKPRARGSRFVL